MKFLLAIFVIIVANIPYIYAVNFQRLNLSEYQSRQLWKLSQLYSCARYFAPNSHIDDLDWYGFIENNICDLLLTTSETQVDSLLLKRFSVLIPDLRFVNNDNIQNHVAVPPFYIKETILNTGYQKSPTTSHLKKVKCNCLKIPQYYSIQLSPILFAVYSATTDCMENETRTLRQLKKKSKYKWGKNFYVSPYYRLANAIITGAYIQHFYAYYEEDGLVKKWEHEQQKYFCQVASCISYSEYLNISYKHYANVNDGHLFVMNGYSKPGALFGKYQPLYYPRVILGISEDGRIYVKNCLSNCEIKKGDEILAVNGLCIQKLIDEKKQFVSAATEADRIGKVLDTFLFQSSKKDSVINLKVKRKNSRQLNYFISTSYNDNYLSVDEEFISFIKDGIWKINPCLEHGVSYKDFSMYIEQFNKAKGLIIDLRGYPNPCILPILSHFIDSTAMVGKILTPTFYAPSHKYVEYRVTENSIWGIHPSTEAYQMEWGYEKPISIKINTPVYFLADRNALSFGETVLELIKNYRIGLIIGEPTSGTNGDAIILRSPSIGYVFTGYKFLNHDGTSHHGIGVIPDIECHQKISDIQNGKDTFVNKACELILDN